jgi:hypothetical protein
MIYTAFHQERREGQGNMSIIKGLFGKKKAENASAPPIRSISVAPGQTQEEQDHNRARMEAELDASRAARGTRAETEDAK